MSSLTEASGFWTLFRGFQKALRRTPCNGSGRERKAISQAAGHDGRMKSRYLRTAKLLSVIIAVPRLAAFWLLLVLEAAGRHSISQLPLVLLLYPEGLLVSNGHVWTAGSALMFSGLLLIGSVILSAVISGLVLLLRRDRFMSS